MAATLTTFFSVGMLLMQYISRRPLPGKAGIQDYLLGNASTLTRADVRSTLIIGGCVLLFLSSFTPGRPRSPLTQVLPR